MRASSLFLKRCQKLFDYICVSTSSQCFNCGGGGKKKVQNTYIRLFSHISLTRKPQKDVFANAGVCLAIFLLLYCIPSIRKQKKFIVLTQLQVSAITSLHFSRLCNNTLFLQQTACVRTYRRTTHYS